MNIVQKRITAPLLVLALALGTSVGGFAQSPSADPASEAWSLSAIAARAIEADPAVRASSALAGIAAAQYKLELDKARPKLSLGLTPLSYDQRRVFDFSAIDFLTFSFDDAYADVQTMSTGAGLSYSQALPTAGSVAAGLKGVLGATEGSADTEWALTPTLNLSLRQPLFAGGEFLPFAAASATAASVAIVAEQAVLDDLGRRNQAVRSAVETAGRVLVLRRTLAVQEALLGSALKRAETFSLRRTSGTATEDAALEFALNAELVRQALVDTKLALHDAERRLASALGLQGEAGAVPSLPPLSGRVPELAALGSLSTVDAPDAVRASLSSRKTRADATSRAVIDAPVLGASLVASPRYPDSRSDPTDFGTLLSDFAETDGGAGFNVNLTLTLDVPLTAGAARGYREQLDALSAEAADAQSKLAERSVADRAAALIGRRDALGERLDIQRRIAELDGRKAERAESLAAAGTVSAEDAADARTEHERSLAEVLRIELDLLLAELDLRALAGQDLAAVLSSVPR